MDKKDFDLKLWSYVQRDSTFFDLPINKVTQLLKSDVSINSGMLVLKSLGFPKITKGELENKYKQDLETSGSESIIYWDKKVKYHKYIYKLNNPKFKSYPYDRFNEVLIYYILQDYLFPDFKYEDLKICEKRMFIRQLITRSPEASERQIESCMLTAGYYLNNKNRWIGDIEDISVMIYDLNSYNCSINGSKLEVFDPAIRIDYEKN